MNSKRKSESSVISEIENTNARVMIVTPTYNRADLIGDTIDSILSQTYKDYIYVIIDDGSIDDTHKVVQEHIKNKKNCFYLRQDNAGEANAVNAGWKLCTSEYFVQVNSDDTIEPNLLREMVSTLDINPRAIGAYSDFYVIDQKGGLVEKFKNVEWDLAKALAAFSCYPAAPGAFIRKSSFQDMKKLKDDRYKYINDIKMLWEIALKGDFIYVPKYLASWRTHKDGISADRYKSIPEVLRWADEYFSQANLPKKVKASEKKCRQSIDSHCARLITKSNVDSVVSDFVAHLNEKLQQQILESGTLAGKNSSLIVQKEDLEQRLKSLELSLSWRITLPLRRTSALLTFIKRKIRSKLYE